MIGFKKSQKFKKFKFYYFKTWLLLIVAVIFLALDATLLRYDHIRMTKLRDAVLAADLAEDDEVISSSLVALKDFTFHHIVINVIENNGNQKIIFGTGPFYLEHQYRRAAEKALAEAENTVISDDNPHGNIYAAAAATCKTRALASGWTWSSPEYIQCMTSEIEKYPAADNLIDEISAAIPSTELYRKNYASPLWAPSLSGFAILLTVVIFIDLAIRFLIWIIDYISSFFA